MLSEIPPAASPSATASGSEEASLSSPPTAGAASAQ